MPENSQNFIEEMDQLLDHINSFKEDLNESSQLYNTPNCQEYKLFVDYLGQRIHDIQKASMIELRQITNSAT